MSNVTPSSSASRSQLLLDRILAAFAAGRRVRIATYTRCTEFQPKHAGLFKASSRETDSGVYVQFGRRWLYVVPSTVVIEGEARS
jgi:predicted secreted protein